MIKSSFGWAALCLATAVGTAQAAFDPNSGSGDFKDFLPTRDAFYDRGVPDNNFGGGDLAHGNAQRWAKFTQYRYLSDFDRAGIKSWIEGKIGKPISSAADLAAVQFNWMLTQRDDAANDQLSVTQMLKPAVYRVATGETWDVTTTSYNSMRVDNLGQAGEVKHPWINADGVTLSNFVNRNGPAGTAITTVANANFEMWAANYAEDAADPTVRQVTGYLEGNFRDFVLDSTVAFALLSDSQAAGLTMLPDLLNNAGINLNDPANPDRGGDSNGRLYSMEAADNLKPYLHVTLVPEPASLGLLALGGLLLARRR